MAYQTGVIQYNGSFKSIRNWRNRKDPKIYASEKGGANRDLIMNNPAFARTRENMNEFGGCGFVVEAIRNGLQQLLPEHADTHFTSRLMKIIKMINKKDPEGERGKRAINISRNKTMLKSLNLHEKRKIDFELKKCIKTSHLESRAEATIFVNGLNPAPAIVPGSPQYYRVIIHLSIISDYAYTENQHSYAPLNEVNGLNAHAYSEYTPINTPLEAAVKATFPEGTVLAETDTVLQCVGIEYYSRQGADGHVPYSTGSMLVYDVF